MAIYRLSANIVKRSEGRSVVACAAYRSGEILHDERHGQTFDYARRQGVAHVEIMAPDGTPGWMFDRAQLWNAVEAVERRKDSQLAREIQLALPHEISPEHRLAIVRQFVQEQFVSSGMIADLAVHTPDPEGDARNHHAHVLLTMRNLTAEGFGNKCRDWNGTDQLKSWRAAWADHVNLSLEKLGRGERIDHRTLAEQGIDREPDPKQGPVATQMERDGRPSHAGDDRRAAKARNDERDALHREDMEISAEILDFEEGRAKRQRNRDRERSHDRDNPNSPEAIRARRQGQWQALAADHDARREALEQELENRRRERLQELEEKQARRALREEADAAGPPPEPTDVLGRWNRRLHTSWNRFLDVLDQRRIEERQRQEKAAAEERARLRTIREQAERDQLIERQDDYDDRVRRANATREKSEKRDLIRAQDREYNDAIERRRREREVSQKQEIGRKPDQKPGKAQDKGQDRGQDDDDDRW